MPCLGFSDGHPRYFAIDCAGARKNNVGASGLAHGVEQRQRADHVVTIIYVRMRYRLTHQARCRQMNNGLDLKLPQRCNEAPFVQDVPRNKRSPVHKRSMADRKVVVADRLKSSFPNCLATMCPDVSGSARNKNPPPSTHARTRFLQPQPSRLATSTNAIKYRHDTFRSIPWVIVVVDRLARVPLIRVTASNVLQSS